MNRHILPLFIALLASLSPAQAADWQLDILVFERDARAAFDPNETGRFQALDWPAMLAIDNDAGVPLDEIPFEVQQSAREQGVQLLAPENSSLRDAARRLNSSGRYAVLTEHSVRFSQKSVTPPMRLHDGAALRLLPRDERPPLADSMAYWRSAPDLAPPVDTESLYGWFRLAHQIHPILSLDISYLRTAPGAFPIQVTPDGTREYYRDQISQFRLKAERMLRDGKIAYFDHPRLGVLARLTAIENSAQADL